MKTIIRKLQRQLNEEQLLSDNRKNIIAARDAEIAQLKTRNEELRKALDNECLTTHAQARALQRESDREVRMKNILAEVQLRATRENVTPAESYHALSVAVQRAISNL